MYYVCVCMYCAWMSGWICLCMYVCMYKLWMDECVGGLYMDGFMHGCMCIYIYVSVYI